MDQESAVLSTQVLTHLLSLEAYQLSKVEKASFFEPVFTELTRYHQRRCAAYQQITRAYKNIYAGDSVTSTLPLDVGLFKTHRLVSSQDIYKELNSSGTTGSPSRIFLDSATASLQSKILVKILQHWLGKKRLPLLFIDAPNTIKRNTGMTARAAGLQGLSFLGYDHTYALDENMNLNLPVIEVFFEKHQNQRVLMFGFTYMVWQQFIVALQQKNKRFNLMDAVLLHGGGWKKLQNKAVSKQEFKVQTNKQLGSVSVHDYYGMVEQTGTIYVECEYGHLHCPVWSDVIIRSPLDLSVCSPGETGLIQVNSLLAHSYPGHCLLTQDLGELVGEDDCECGRKGKYFKVHGRVPKAEVRGCSDTFS